MKEYATFKDLVDEVAKQIGVDLKYNCLKLKYKIEGSNTPLEILNEMSVRVYVSLKKENKKLAKYPICVTMFVKDCELTDRNLYEDNVHMSGIDGRDTIDTQALVLSAPLVSNAINNEIISNINQTEVMEDQVYKDKETLKAVMRKYAFDHRFQWKTDISSEISYTLFIKGYESCRTIVVVDGSHLRGAYNGAFVSASTLDGAEMLAENEERSVRMMVVATSNYVHSVHHEGSTFIVCLERKTCTCRRFQMDEIPCSHAWAVLKKKFLDPEPMK
ncbi:hypothetical protein KY289_025640 [Solanum tuberosum]|nr:hypothetical protein KY289_025640 [Solanum tuberosum]